jgi:hypothetical protein
VVGNIGCRVLQQETKQFLLTTGNKARANSSGLREGRAPNSVTLSFLPLTHQIIAVCVYSSRDHRSKNLSLLYGRVLRAQPRGMRHTGVICAPGS